MGSLLLERKVLIVDDEAPILEVLTRYFKRRGFSVLQAATGALAIQLFKEHRPQIVLLDILMPGQSGLETLRQLKALSADFKAVMISAVHDEAVFSQCRRYGAADYIVKPFDLAYLDALVLGKLLCG